MGIPLAFDVENIYFINDYDLEKGDETGLIHTKGKTKGTQMSMTPSEAKTKAELAVKINTEERTPVTSIEDLI